METIKENTGKKNLLKKTWKRCRSFPGGADRVLGLSKSKSWHVKEEKKTKVAPEGCFPVYVRPGKERFAVKTKYAYHALFRMLLEESETEYGHKNDGPIMLPCDVDLFYKVLAEMKGKEVDPYGGSRFVHGSCSPFSAGRRLAHNGVHHMAKGYGSYELLSPSSRLI